MSREAQEFAVALQAAVQGLRQFAERAEAGSRALADQERRARTGGGGAAGAFAAAGAAVAGAPLAVAGAFTQADPRAVGRGIGFAASGDFQAAQGQAGLAALAAFDQLNIGGVPVGRVLSEASGAAGLERQLAGTQQRVLDVTGDLARYGIEVSPEFREGLAKGFGEQEKRVEAERRAVAGEVGKLANPEIVAGAEKAFGAVEGLLREILDAIRSFGLGGAQR